MVCDLSQFPRFIEEILDALALQLGKIAEVETPLNRDLAAVVLATTSRNLRRLNELHKSQIKQVTAYIRGQLMEAGVLLGFHTEDDVNYGSPKTPNDRSSDHETFGQ